MTFFPIPCVVGYRRPLSYDGDPGVVNARLVFVGYVFSRADRHIVPDLGVFPNNAMVDPSVFTDMRIGHDNRIFNQRPRPITTPGKITEFLTLP